MARGVFATANYFLLGSAPVNAEPLTMACWIYPSALANTRTAMCINYGTGSAVAYTGFQLNLFSSNKIRAVKSAYGSPVYSESGGTVSNTTWAHIGAVFGSTASRFAYLNGTAGTENTSTNALAHTPDRTVIGGRISEDASILLPSATLVIAEAGIWNVALTAADMLQLAAGYSPLFVKPESLAAYYPLIRGDSSGDEPDLMNGAKMVEQGTVAVQPHPRVFMPWNVKIGKPLAAAVSYTLQTTTGSFVLTGNNAIELWNHKTYTTTGGFTWAGNNSVILAYHKVRTTSGSFTLTGNNSIELWAHKVYTTTGVYAWTGNNAILTKMTVGGYLLQTTSGSFTLTGNNAVELWKHQVRTTTGAFIWTGNDAILTFGLAASYSLMTTSGIFLMIGMDAILQGPATAPAVSTTGGGSDTWLQWVTRRRPVQIIGNNEDEEEYLLMVMYDELYPTA